MNRKEAHIVKKMTVETKKKLIIAAAVIVVVLLAPLMYLLGKLFR